MPNRKKLRLIGLVVASIVALTLIIQNRGSVTTQFFLIDVRMPLALLILVILLIGFLLGLLTAQLMRR